MFSFNETGNQTSFFYYYGTEDEYAELDKN